MRIFTSLSRLQLTEHTLEPTIAHVLQDCLKKAQEAEANSGYPLVIIGTACDSDKIPISVLGAFKEELTIEVSAMSNMCD